jgi:hypothetical protein
VIALFAGGLIVALLPFDRPLPRGSFTYGSYSAPSSCASPIVSAWRDDSYSGWFGYVPLTSTPYSAPMSCMEAGRRRLALGGVLMGAGAFVLLLRRRRFHPPTNPGPNLAT